MKAQQISSVLKLKSKPVFLYPTMTPNGEIIVLKTGLGNVPTIVKIGRIKHRVKKKYPGPPIYSAIIQMAPALSGQPMTLINAGQSRAGLISGFSILIRVNCEPLLQKNVYLILIFLRIIN